MFKFLKSRLVHLSKLSRRKRRGAGNSSREKSAVRLSLEFLEDRVLLAVRFWTGLSTTDSNWSDPANWAGSVAPMPDDQLVFPSGAQRERAIQLPGRHALPLHHRLRQRL